MAHISSEKSTANIVSHQIIDTEYSADSVEWCPLPGFSDILMCGTYQLADPDSTVQHELEVSKEDETGTMGNEEYTPSMKRLGRLYGFRLSHDMRDNTSPHLTLCYKQETAAILDMKWSHHLLKDRPCLGIVDSSGNLAIHLIDKYSSKLDLECEQIIEVVKDGLALSLDWSDRLQSTDRRIVVSDSQGCISICKYDGSQFVTCHTWKAHDYEAWISAWDYWETDIIYTGGDDCKLKVWDTRTSLASPIITSKRHSMGVCSIQSNPHREHMFASGSYDEHILTWDRRSMKKPLSDTPIGGGVWRLKWHPFHPDLILAACMHNGFHIINLTDTADESSGSVVGSYMNHKSLAYGVDWSIPVSVDQNDKEEKSSSDLIASCSFYDHILHLWTCSY